MFYLPYEVHKDTAFSRVEMIRKDDIMQRNVQMDTQKNVIESEKIDHFAFLSLVCQKENLYNMDFY